LNKGLGQGSSSHDGSTSRHGDHPPPLEGDCARGWPTCSSATIARQKRTVQKTMAWYGSKFGYQWTIEFDLENTLYQCTNLR
jgi:hypothetical protein